MLVSKRRPGNSQHTLPEIAVRRVLYALGFRYRLHAKDLPGKPDVLFRGKRRAIFVNGCFWHQHADCKKAMRPHSNVAWWNRKLDTNLRRDRQNYDLLVGSGWNVLCVWECQTKNVRLLQELLLDFLGSHDHQDKRAHAKN
jgi:DNA mismatch endonuclease (patch repair protein)